MSTTQKVSQAADRFTFYTNIEYWNQLITQIRSTRPGDRLLLMTMTFNPTEPHIAAVIEAATAATARGVNVSVSIDAHSFLLKAASIPDPLWSRRELPKKLPRLYRYKLEALERINAYPTGHADIINMPQRNINLPIAGRSHIKAAIINDQIFLGGCNLQGSRSMDMMIGWRDKIISDRLYESLTNIIHKKHAGRALAWVDRSMNVDDYTDIFIDSGMRNQSLILEEALQLIDSAQDWLLLTCQFFPNSITAKHLLAAKKRGVKVEIIFAHPKHHGLLGGVGQHINILRERTRVPKSMFANALTRKDPMLHAKLIACDQGVMIGSHNYVTAGVMLGTAEIALKSSDVALAYAAVETLQRGLKAARQSVL